MQEIIHFMQHIKDLKAIQSVLSWDQETYMPPGAAEARAEQVATLAAQIHQLVTSEQAHRLVKEARRLLDDGEVDEGRRRLLALFVEDIERENKLPEEHIRRLAFLTSEAQVVWRQAREENNFSAFAPYLKQLIELQQQTAEYLEYEEHPYDALLDAYEPGMTVRQLRPLFTELKSFLKQVLEVVQQTDRIIDRRWLFQYYPASDQVEFAKETVKAVGFDFARGRVDLSTHPFCTSFAPVDVRLTTRVHPQDFRTCFFSLLHEAGHGMYEQGLGGEYPRSFAISGASMGIHESQSLFWEDIIGRSVPFWRWNMPRMAQVFPQQVVGIDPQEAFRAVNVVEPGFIRIDADELTYHFHIILRFELELQLFEGTLSVSVIPEAWSAKMEEYLGLLPPTDALGCLQDIHWSFGGFGYFPTYTLGKLYAAMFWEQLQKEIPDVEEGIERGEFQPILRWLRKNIHYHGRLKKPAEIVADVCGQPLSIAAFRRYLSDKLEQVYEIKLEGISR